MAEKVISQAFVGCLTSSDTGKIAGLPGTEGEGHVPVLTSTVGPGPAAEAWMTITWET